MRLISLLLVPAALFAGQARYARLGEFEGTVEVQLTAADSWMPAQRNLPLVEAAWLRTAAASRLEIELDEGSAWRLGPDSQGELSDYTRLSTGQRVTLLSLDRGVCYFTGQPRGMDALTLAVPGAQITFLRGARVRLEAGESFSRIAVFEGSVRFSSPAAEIDLREGQTVRVEPSNTARFFLDREVTAMELDQWSQQRDKAEAGSPSAGHVLGRYGLVDLDAEGDWVQTDDLGAVWKPKQTEGWYPFQQGRWRWYDALGYTWVSDDKWGWLPYHYGRWQRKEQLGWVWAPSVSTVFKPGDVYWLRGAKLTGWGPLAPGEEWTPPQPPEQFYRINTSYAAFQPDTRAIDPAGFGDPPKEPLQVAAFVPALPSPLFAASRLDATRPVLRAGSTRVTPVLNGVTYQDEPTPPPLPPPSRPARPTPPVIIVTPPAEAPPPETVFVPMPVYTGYILTPPGNSKSTAVKPASAPASSVSSTTNTGMSTTATGTPARGNRHTPAEPPHVEPELPNTPPKKFRNSGESEMYNAVIRDTSDPAKQIQALDAWAQKYPRSDFIDDRLYLYVQAYARVKPAQPARLLDYGAQLIAKDVKTVFQDPQQVLVVLYLVTVNASMLPGPGNFAQLKAGARAAQELLDGLPTFFAADRKPPDVSPTDWRKSRADMEAVARKTLASVEQIARLPRH
jgi:hypothetical protein